MAKRLLRKPRVKELTGLPFSTINLSVSLGEFPKPILLGARSVGWDSEAVEMWIQARIAGCATAQIIVLVSKIDAGDSLDEIRKLTSSISLASSTAEIRELIGKLTAPPRAVAKIQDLREQLDAARLP